MSPRISSFSPSRISREYFMRISACFLILISILLSPRCSQWLSLSIYHPVTMSIAHNSIRNMFLATMICHEHSLNARLCALQRLLEPAIHITILTCSAFVAIGSIPYQYHYPILIRHPTRAADNYFTNTIFLVSVTPFAFRVQKQSSFNKSPHPDGERHVNVDLSGMIYSARWIELLEDVVT